jgi:hypothetical protein
VFFPPDSAFFKHQTSSFFPNSPYILPITPQIKVPITPMLVHAQSNEPIVCTIPNCTKTFRKQSLLEYHLKYHHYVDLNSPMPLQLQAQTNPMSPKRSAKRATRRSSSNQTDTTRTNKDSMSNFGDEDSSFLFDGLDNLEDDDTTDPYEVIHCKCGNHTSIGFMIQCEVCLCWQHGKCMSIESNEKTPKHYSCWICAEPENKLRKLKYQSWMSSHLERELINRKDMRLLSQELASQKENKEVKETKPDVDYLKLKLINECSRKYYNLNLLMHTLEYQMSMLSKITSNETIRKELDERSRNEDYEFGLNESGVDHDIFSQIDKLALNVTHLQSCLTKKFEEFNSKLDGGFYLFSVL